MKVYKKLVRDKIPEIIRSRGDTAVTRVLTDKEFSEYLTKKLAEEVQEFLADGTAEELADIYEVILAILRHMDMTFESFEALRKRKLLERGGFSEKILLEAVIEKGNRKPHQIETGQGADTIPSRASFQTRLL